MLGVFVEGGGGGCALVVWCGLDQMVHAPDRSWTRSLISHAPFPHTHSPYRLGTLVGTIWAFIRPSFSVSTRLERR